MSRMFPAQEAVRNSRPPLQHDSVLVGVDQAEDLRGGLGDMRLDMDEQQTPSAFQVDALAVVEEGARITSESEFASVVGDPKSPVLESESVIE